MSVYTHGDIEEEEEERRGRREQKGLFHPGDTASSQGAAYLVRDT